MRNYAHYATYRAANQTHQELAWAASLTAQYMASQRLALHETEFREKSPASPWQAANSPP